MYFVTPNYITSFKLFIPKSDRNDYREQSQGFSYRIMKTNDSVMRIYTLILRLKKKCINY